MAFNGSGIFNRVYNWTQDAANSIDITASRVDTEDTGFATGLSLCVTRDGQGAMSADFLAAAANTYALGSATTPWSQIVTAAFQSTKTATQGWGPTAAALVDMTQDTGTFLGTFTGFTTVVTGTVTWFRSGKRISLIFPPSTTGTSNASNFRMTGLPTALQPITEQDQNLCAASIFNNGAFVGTASPFNCQALVTASGTIAFALGASTTGWATSGSKGFVSSCMIDYYLI